MGRMRYLLAICMMKSSINATLSALALAIALLLPSAVSAQHPPRVLTTIAPLHLLTLGVTEGISTPAILLRPGDSPHHFGLTPEGAQKIADSDVIICVSEKAERYIRAVLPAFQDRHFAIIEALAVPGIAILPANPDGAHKELSDMHFWLNPVNAIAYTQYIAEYLSNADAANARRYHQNAQQQVARLKALDASVRATLGHLPRQAQYASYHPSLAYFEQHYHIRPLPAVTRTPESGASAAEATALSQRIDNGQLRCLFREPEFSPRLLERAVERTEGKVQLITLDPLGSTYPVRAESYDAMLTDIAGHVVACSQPVEAADD
jgi:zinc transport system substrate-binding protein